MFRDKFTDFTFNGTPSKDMKVWITNSHDLSESIAPEVKDTYVAPSFTDGRYYSGSSINKTSILLKCIAINITVQEKRAITRWLNPKNSGKLILNSDPYHYYNVKVDKEIQATKWVRGKYDRAHGGYLYIYEFTVSFSTVSDWAKLGHAAAFDLQYLIARDGDAASNNPYYDLFKSNNENDIKTKKMLNKKYTFINNYNEYNLSQFLRSDYCFLLPGVYSWEEIGKKLGYGIDEGGRVIWRDTLLYFLRILQNNYGEEILPSLVLSNYQGTYTITASDRMEDLYPLGILENQDGLEIYYPCIVDTIKENSHTSFSEKAFSVVNVGSLPMYYDYFINGVCAASDSHYDFSLSLNDQIQYRTGIRSPFNGYFYNFSINSSNGIILNNGDFCQNAKDTMSNIHLNDSYENIGVSTIDVGNAEIVNCTKDCIIKPKAYFKSRNGGGILSKQNLLTSEVSLSSKLLSKSENGKKTGVFYTFRPSSIESIPFRITVSCDNKMATSIIQIGDLTYKNSVILTFEPEIAEEEFKEKYKILQDEEVIFNFNFVDKDGAPIEIENATVTLSLDEKEYTEEEYVVLRTVDDLEKNWYTWSYVFFDIPNIFNFTHNNLVHLSFFDKKGYADSNYSIESDFVPEDFSSDTNSINMLGYSIPYVDEENNSFLRIIVSPTDSEKIFKYKFIDKVIVSKDGVIGLEAPGANVENWIPQFIYNIPNNFLFNYVSIGDANKVVTDFEIDNSETVYSRDISVDDAIMNESFVIQAREV